MRKNQDFSEIRGVVEKELSVLRERLNKKYGYVSKVAFEEILVSYCAPSQRPVSDFPDMESFVRSTYLDALKLDG